MPYADGRLRPDETFVNDRFGGRIYVDVGQTTHSRIFPEGDFKDAIVRDQAARQAFAQGRFDQITQHDGGGSTQRPTTPTRSGHGTGRSAVDLAVAHTGHGNMMRRYTGRQVQPHQESLRTVYRSQILRNIAQSAGDMAGARMLVSPPRSQYATVTERELQNAAALYSA